MYLKYRHPIVQSEEITLHYNLLWRRLPVIVVSGFVIKQFIPSRAEHVVTLARVLCEVTTNNEREGLTSWVELLGIISEKYCAAMINVRLLQYPCNYCRVTNDPDVTIRRFEAEQRKMPNLSSLSFAISDTGFIPVDQFAESISAIISTINYKSQMQSESRQ